MNRAFLRAVVDWRLTFRDEVYIMKDETPKTTIFHYLRKSNVDQFPTVERLDWNLKGANSSNYLYSSRGYKWIC